MFWNMAVLKCHNSDMLINSHYSNIDDIVLMVHQSKVCDFV